MAFADNARMSPSEWRDHASNEPQVVSVTTEDMLRAFEGWGSDVTGLLGCIKQPSKWNIDVVYPPLSSYVRDRVVLLGDAVSIYLGSAADMIYHS